jgi:hypothetical protein
MSDENSEKEKGIFISGFLSDTAELGFVGIAGCASTIDSYLWRHIPVFRIPLLALLSGTGPTGTIQLEPQADSNR